MPKETNKKQGKEKQNKDKKHFMKDFKAELKRVIWPTPKQLLNNTISVITIFLLTAVIVFVLDFAFEKMNEYGIEKLKSVVETTNTLGNASGSENITNDSATDTDTADNNTQTNQTSENVDGE